MSRKVTREDTATVRNKVAWLLAWPAEYQPSEKEENVLRHFGECHSRWDASNRRRGMSLNIAAEQAVAVIKRQSSRAA